MNTSQWKQDFPIFQTHPDLIYLDTAASAQKPKLVLDGLLKHYTSSNANIHRGVYTIAEQATMAYEAARDKVAHFINAPSSKNIIFVKNTTEALNFVAYSLSDLLDLTEKKQLVLSVLEHHANYLPWWRFAQQNGLTLETIGLDDQGHLDSLALKQALSPETALLTLTQASHVLGTTDDLTPFLKIARQLNIPSCVDAAQAIAHQPIDVQALDCDFLAFSGHKIYAPTGIGVLYISDHYLDQLSPYQLGGGMIANITDHALQFLEPPHCFEAGTPPIAEAIALGYAIDYITAIGFPAIQKHESSLLTYLKDQLQAHPIAALQFLPSGQHNVGILSCYFESIHAHDLATVLASEQIAVRAGHHCALPLMHYLNQQACTRISFGLYNDQSDIDHLITALDNARKLFRLGD